jgi:hypothetical protein
MTELLKFVLSSFWTFSGTIILAFSLAVAVRTAVPGFKFKYRSKSRAPESTPKPPRDGTSARR